MSSAKGRGQCAAPLFLTLRCSVRRMDLAQKYALRAQNAPVLSSGLKSETAADRFLSDFFPGGKEAA